MPRGVAIPEVRQQLFAAVERVIARNGPGRLSGRAVTAEAGVATGLLHAHFADLDDFLAAYAVDRAFLVSAGAGALAERVGTGDVAENLCEAIIATPPSTVGTLAKLLVARPELAARVHGVLGDGTAGLDAIEHAVAAYLAAEQERGRVSAKASPEALALAVVGALHHLVLTTPDDVHPRLRQVVGALLGAPTKRP
ncbi:TetR family transcriptional regulator [Allokutzneria sp. NRRL B-24872]|uniref:TetR family transcriptional regulator n=1 Tax=Allokutzneria sp. NRRL B-24872 TaxID=1137961 RepID=UPI000A3C72FB|nr:TetR family transcriptional regulator [Allokutzneria sp. NRRL B-24872]